MIKKSQIPNPKSQKQITYIKTFPSEGPARPIFDGFPEPQIVLAPSVRCGALWGSPSSRHPFLGLFYNSLTINSKLKARIILFSFSLLSFTLCALSLGADKTYAQSLSLSISPPILEVLIKPGKSITQAYKIANNGEATVVTAKIVEFSPNGIKEDKDFIPENWISAVGGDFAFNRPFLLSKGAEKQLLLRVNPPVGAAQQDYYRAIIFTTTPAPPSEYSQSAASVSIGSILLIRITATGLLTLSAQISQFTLPSIIDSFGPLTARIDVKNTGKTYFRPIGSISLTGPVGRGKYNISPEVIFAGQTKLITSEIGSSKNQTLALSGFYLGKYQLGVNFTLDEGTITVAQTKTFYALPWKAGLGILVFLFLISIMYRRKRRKGNRFIKAAFLSSRT